MMVWSSISQFIDLIVHDPLSSLAYPMIIYTRLVADNLPTKTLGTMLLQIHTFAHTLVGDDGYGESCHAAGSEDPREKTPSMGSLTTSR